MHREELVPRQGVYEHYWHFVGERQQIFERRARGDAPPWTDDPILGRYKFCNVYRAADRVSQYMIRDICYGGAAGEDLAFQITAFRTFSRISAWETVKNELGQVPTIDDLASGRFERALSAIKDSGSKLYTGAFILCANDAYGRGIKHLNHVEMFKAMFVTGDLYDRVVAAPSLQGCLRRAARVSPHGRLHVVPDGHRPQLQRTHRLLRERLHQGWPGCAAGIAKVFESTRGWKPEEVIMWMVDHQEEEMARLGIEFNGLYGRPLQAIDCQNCFCETDKYCREAVPELASNRTRIKTVFASTPSRSSTSSHPNGA